MDSNSVNLRFMDKGGMRLQDLVKICKWRRPLSTADDKNVNSLSYHVIYLEIGTNDLCLVRQAEETFARQVVSFAFYLRKGFGVNCVIIGQILHRHGPTRPNHNFINHNENS